MRKTDKKMDNSIRLVLTEVCERALQEHKGFLWLTHLVNYNQFPNSLKIVCIFDTDDHLQAFLNSSGKASLHQDIIRSLKLINIPLNSSPKLQEHLVCYDTEEKCLNQHNGNWALRLETH